MPVTKKRDGANGLALGARGYRCHVFDDPETAWALHQETHLIAWQGQKDSDLLVDRFDARNLLNDRRQFRQLKKRKRRASQDGHLDATGGRNMGTANDTLETKHQQELHRLRFGEYAVEFPRSEDVVVNRFPYHYPDEATSDQTSDDEAFEPPWAVPEHLVVVRSHVTRG